MIVLNFHDIIVLKLLHGNAPLALTSRTLNVFQSRIRVCYLFWSTCSKPVLEGEQKPKPKI